MRCAILVLLLLLSSCAAKVQAPQPHQRVFMVPSGARATDLICLAPDTGPLLGQCVTVARFKVATHSIFAN